MSLSDDPKTQSNSTAADVEAAIPEIARQRPEVAKMVADLERQLRLARGTGEHAEEAAKAMAKVQPKPPERDRVQQALLRESLTIQQLAKTLAEPAGKVAELIRQLRQEKLIYNVGLAEFPIWTWRPGDHIESAALNALVRRLISERPFTTRELVDAIGARMSRVGGAIVAIQRSGEHVVDLNTDGRAGRWFLISDKARDARLEPKKPKDKH